MSGVCRLRILGDEFYWKQKIFFCEVEGMNKVTIIGTGSVGSTIAYTLAVTGQVSEIIMIDVNNEKALGEALDIRQGTPFAVLVRFTRGLIVTLRDRILWLSRPVSRESRGSRDLTLLRLT